MFCSGSCANRYLHSLCPACRSPYTCRTCMTVRNGLTPADCTCSITTNPTSKKGRIALLCMAGFAKA